MATKNAIVPGTWQWQKVFTAGIVPGPRHVCASVIYKESLWVFAGYGWKGCYLNDLYEYSFESREWRQVLFTDKANLPPELHSASSVIYTNKLVLFGGIGPNGQKRGDTITYDFDTSKWEVVTTTGVKPSPRWGHSAVVYQDTMYLFGGFSDTFQQDFYAFDLKTNHWTKLQTNDHTPKARQFHTAVVYKDAMYVFGGFAANKNLCDLHKFTFATNRWSSIAFTDPAPVPRRGHSAVVYKNCMYIFAGKGATATSLGDLIEYNFENGQLREVPPFGENPCTRHFHVGCVWKDAMYIFGGLSQVNLNDLYRFPFDLNASEPVQEGLISLSELFLNPVFSDVTFVVEGKELKAHRNILYCRCDHFKAMFSGGLKESKDDTIEIKDTSYDIFKAIVEFIYTNKATITTDNAVELLVISDRYLLPKLTAQCEAVLRRYVDSDNAGMLLRVARLHRCLLLARACEDSLEDEEIAAIDSEIQAKPAASAATIPIVEPSTKKQKRPKKKKPKAQPKPEPTIETSADDLSSASEG